MQERTSSIKFPAEAVVYRMSREVIGLLENTMEVNIHGLNNLDYIKKVGPVVSALGNHESHVDGWLMCRILHRYTSRLVAPGAADYWETDRLKSTIAKIGVPYVPLHRKGSLRDKVRDFEYLQTLAQGGYTVFIATPGTRHGSDSHKDGAAKLAVRVGIPIIPTVVHGTREIMPPGARLPKPIEWERLRRKSVTFIFGRPLCPDTSLREHYQTIDLMSRYVDALAALQDQMSDIVHSE